MELIEKLAQLNPNLTANEVRSAFKGIAEEIFGNYHIEKNGQRYYFLEIEFYFCSKKHPDIITYPRNTTEGRFYFHPSGIDLTFRSEYKMLDGKDEIVDVNNQFAFGGILIRKLLKWDTKQIIDGPHKCEWELFDSFDAFQTMEKERPRLVINHKPIEFSMKQSARKFSYSKEQMKKKYDRLIQTNFQGLCEVTYEVFSEYIKEDFAYKITINDTGTENWHVQLFQSVSLEKGKFYRFSFKAKSTVDRNIECVIDECIRMR